MVSEELKTLKRIEELLEAIARNALRDTLNSALVDKEHKFLYENTGRLPVRQLAKKLDWSVGTISRTWQAWEAAGLLVKDGKQYKKVL